ncbi:probable prolyl 4-hydroxylase 3 isoform X2 [Xenia sp. Carnegie-2017]|uniref:probable prolyl 4-hydroxylase 3 isoform X2 n=1 Tax=Xenia sp. Carnegie-2017 TaxID=2897299 RepID=UPI001F044F11|nr:probable prolyl 4-hydroxylase 3 isoform X2 [Xenia sp. Carnegie-2017]
MCSLTINIRIHVLCFMFQLLQFSLIERRVFSKCAPHKLTTFLKNATSLLQNDAFCNRPVLLPATYQSTTRVKAADFKKLHVQFLDDLDLKADCVFDHVQWNDILDNIIAVEGQRITKNHEPDVFVIPNFFTNEQCEKLISTHNEMKKSAKSLKKLWKFATSRQLLETIHQSFLSPHEYKLDFCKQYDCDEVSITGENIDEKLLYNISFSSSVLLARGENSLVDLLEGIIEEKLGLPKTNAYHTQLVKYRINSEYNMHTDCHEITNDRMATIIVYLNDVEQGGETVFQAMNISVKPQKGKAVVWKNLNLQGKCDAATSHVAAKVIKGQKLIYQKWFYQKPIMPSSREKIPVYCDLSGSCREYIYNVSSTKAVKLMNMYEYEMDPYKRLEHCEQALYEQYCQDEAKTPF